MNSTSLHALVVDHHSGELSPEVAELLETYLGENADARAEALRIREALSITEETVLRHPELGRAIESKVEDAQKAFCRRAKFNGAARSGSYAPEWETAEVA